MNTENTSPLHTNDDNSSKSLAWLKDLGIQSWQAELVISGLVITGLFQMPEIFMTWLQGYIIRSNSMEYMFFNLASTYILFAINSLIFIFGVHLIFRGIWIALLGLDSVYPDGINTTSESGMGPEFWKLSKEKYPNLTRYCGELDANCSILFSVATYVSIIMISISILVLFMFQIFKWMIELFPIIENHIVGIGISLYLIFLVVAFTFQYLGKKYPTNKKLKNVIDKYSEVLGFVFSLYFFKKPIGYISSILFSNTNSRKFILYMLLICGISGILIGRSIFSFEVLQHFKIDKYYTFNNKAEQLLDLNYENLNQNNKIIYSPIIQSDIIRDKYIKLFIPTIDREKEQMKIFEIRFLDNFKFNREQKDSIMDVNGKIFRKFNHVFLNDTEYPNLEYQLYKHPKAMEVGLLMYIPTDSCKLGRNILEIRKDYFSRDSIQKIIKIPFIFEK